METKKTIGELLIEFGLIDSQSVTQALKLQKATGLRLGELLVRMRKVSMEDLEWVLSRQIDTPYVFIDEKGLDMELIKRYPIQFLLKNSILPVFETDAGIWIVTSDPFNTSAFDYLKNKSGKDIKVSSGNAGKIESVLKKFIPGDSGQALVSYLEDLFPRIKNTSFYRLDFLLAGNLGVSLYGGGITRPMPSIKERFEADAIFRALEIMRVPFLYSLATDGNDPVLSVYPVLNRFHLNKFPAVLGLFGLCRPDEIVLTDAQVCGLPNFFHSAASLEEYLYFSLAGTGLEHDKTIFTADSAPSGGAGYFIKGYRPGVCPSCGGSGCNNCAGLGYSFIQMEGLYSSSELKNRHG